MAVILHGYVRGIGGLQIRFVHINHLIEAKKAAGRYKDLDDKEQLTKK